MAEPPCIIIKIRINNIRVNPFNVFLPDYDYSQQDIVTSDYVKSLSDSYQQAAL